MLVKCPECELQVSDKAIACPHCGYPMQQSATKRKPRKKNNKRRRLPNGFGQISEIKNRNLRKPFRAMVTVGKDENGRPICKTLKPEAYFATYNEAYEALVEYNRNPYDLSPSITVKELYERWSKQHYANLSDSAIRAFKGAWAYSAPLYDMKVADVRIRHMKACLENATANIKGQERHPSSNVKANMKKLYNLMFDYAVEYEIVDKNPARTFKLNNDVIKESRKNRKSHIAFTDEEMDILWKNVGTVPYVDVLLIQCYSGWRPQELGLIELRDVDLENWTFKGGMKTEAGADRVVPIHPKIRGLVQARYEEAIRIRSDHLINNTQSKKYLTYKSYAYRFNFLIKELALNPEHRPHDGRVQFVTMAKKYKVEEYAIKYIVGHSINDITEKVYTKRDIKWLEEEIAKIK